jgi:hypothetical protein
MRSATINMAAVGVLGALPLLAGACSDNKAAPGSGATTGTAAGATSASASGTATAKAASCAIDETQYVDWDDWGKGCGFAVPKAPGALPPRIGWEPCGAAVGLSGCKKLKPRAGATLHGVRAGGKRADVVEVGFVEECAFETSKHALLVIAEVDGPTLAAFASKGHEAGKCDVDVLSIHQGAYTARLTEAGENGPGALVGAPTQTSKPALLRSWEAGKAERGAIASDVRWVSFGPNGAKTGRWGDTEPETLTDNALDVQPVLHHDEIFWADVDLHVVKTAPKIEKLRASQNGGSAASFGTDGMDLVFSEKLGGEGEAKTVLVAGGYATEADKLNLKSILPLGKAIDATPWTVGCGHAAHATAANEVLLVRLKDGVSWTASSKGCDQNELCFQRPLALTCKEVFLAAASKDSKQESIVRVTLAGLGKGKEPAEAPAALGAAPAASASASASASTSASAAPAASATATAAPKP